MKFRNSLTNILLQPWLHLGVVAALALAALVALNGPAHAGNMTAKVKLHNTAGQAVGLVKFSQENDGAVQVQIKVNNLPAGFHGFHVHTVGSCTPDFNAAGGHFNPEGQHHGHHAGDLPVLQISANGTGQARFNLDRFKVADLFDPDGSAVIIHANPDNYANIPADRYDPDPDDTTLKTGDAGGRIACGVVEAE